MTVTTTPPATRDTAAPPPPRGLASRAGTVLLGLALVAAAVGAQHLVLKETEESAPLTYAGGMGDAVDAYRFSARALSVKAARAMEIPQVRGFKAIPTDNVFLVVEASATVPREPMKLSASLLSGDLRYSPTDKVPDDLTMGNQYIQPGWWATGRFVFEVPADALPGARLAVHIPPAILVEPYPPEAEIDLGLDDAAARALVAEALPAYRLGRG